MKRVDVAEFESDAGRYLAEVRGGETVLVCASGEPVARLEACEGGSVPEPELESGETPQWAQDMLALSKKLLAEGGPLKIRHATRPLSDVREITFPPLPLEQGYLDRIMAEERDDRDLLSR
jgi:antitoxin (DNA-binding transcriptional repressor) of toxin-antitoxin stability system